MLSLTETKAISNAQLDTQLLVSLRKAVDAVTAKATAPGADEAIAWNDCSANDFKEQLPGSVLMLLDGSFRYVPTNSAFRVASGVQQLRMSTTGKDGGGTWKEIESVEIKQVAWGCCTSNGKAGSRAAGLKLGDAPASLRPEVGSTDFTKLLVQAQGCAPEAYLVEDAPFSFSSSPPIEPWRS